MEDQRGETAEAVRWVGKGVERRMRVRSSGGRVVIGIIMWGGWGYRLEVGDILNV